MYVGTVLQGILLRYRREHTLTPAPSFYTDTTVSTSLELRGLAQDRREFPLVSRLRSTGNRKIPLGHNRLYLAAR